MKNIIYHAREGSPFKEEDAQEVGEFIRNHSGKKTGEILKEIKKNKKNVIYSYIEWDDKKASHQYRLHQVRNIISHIEVEIIRVGDTEPTRVRAMYHVVDARGSVYMDINSVFSEKEYSTQIIEKAKIELTNWIERYETYKELEKIRKSIKKLLIEEITTPS